MNVYLLQPRDEHLNLWPDLDAIRAAVVVAADEGHARTLLTLQAGDEGPAMWQSSNFSSCELLDTTTACVVVMDKPGF